MFFYMCYGSGKSTSGLIYIYILTEKNFQEWQQVQSSVRQHQGDPRLPQKRVHQGFLFVFNLMSSEHRLTLPICPPPLVVLTNKKSPDN